jgi:hypothetical protein
MALSWLNLFCKLGEVCHFTTSAMNLRMFTPCCAYSSESLFPLLTHSFVLIIPPKRRSNAILIVANVSNDTFFGQYNEMLRYAEHILNTADYIAPPALA